MFQSQTVSPPPAILTALRRSDRPRFEIRIEKHCQASAIREIDPQVAVIGSVRTDPPCPRDA